MKPFRHSFLFSRLLPAAALAVLAACSGGVPKPAALPDVSAATGHWFRLTQYSADGRVLQNSLLAVEQGPNALRFVQTDALGAPVSRQILTAKGWRNDGFVMPNTPARRLFAALLPVLADGAAPLYPDLARHTETTGECYRRQGRNLWCTVPENGGWRIAFPDRMQWSVTPLEE